MLGSSVAVAQMRGRPVALDNGLMSQNFLSCEREQVLLMPPSLRDWLPADHLAWFVLAAVETSGALIASDTSCGSKLIAAVPAGSYQVKVTRNGAKGTYKLAIMKA